MKSILTLIICILAFSICNSQDYDLFNQDTLKVYFAEKDSSQFMVLNLNTDKCGILSQSGEVIVPFKYQHLGKTKEGLRLTILNSKYGFLDDNGDIKIDFEYYGGKTFSNGKAIMLTKDGYGVIDKNNNVFIPFKYGKLVTYDHKYYSFKVKDQKMGIMDSNENIIVDPVYDNIILLNDSIWITLKNGMLEVLRYNGENELNEVFNSIGRASYSGYINVIKDGKNGLLDEHYNWILKPKYKKIKSLFTNYIGIQDDIGWKVYDKNKNQVIDKVFQKIVFLDTAHCIVTIDGRDNIINNAGEYMFGPETKSISKVNGEKSLLLVDNYLYDGLTKNKILEESISLVSNYPEVYKGMLAINTDGKCAVIDTLGNYIIPPKYSFCKHELSRGYIHVKDPTSNKWGLLNLENDLIVPMKYDYVEHYSGSEDEAKYWLYNENSQSFFANQKILVSDIDSIVNSLGDFIFFIKEAKLGVINSYEGSVKMLEYDSVIVDNSPFIVIQNGKYGTLDSQCNLAIPIEYNYLKAAGSFLITKKGNKYGTLSRDNKVLEQPQFDKIEKRMFQMYGIVHLDGKMGLLNIDGYLLLPVEYDSIDVKYNGLVIAKKGNESFQFNQSELQLKLMNKK